MNKQNTVRIGKNKMMRIGRGLLGSLAGNRKLRVSMQWDSQKRSLVLTIREKPPGWPVTYWSPWNKSPFVSLVPFMKLYALPDNWLQVGEFPAEVHNKRIVIKWK